MGHNWNCPDEYEARREARRDADRDAEYRWGSRSYRSPYECDGSNETYRREYEREFQQREEEMAQERRRQQARDEQRQQEEWAEQDAWEQERQRAAWRRGNSMIRAFLTSFTGGLVTGLALGACLAVVAFAAGVRL